MHVGSCACCGDLILGPCATLAQGANPAVIVCADSTDCRLRAARRLAAVWMAAIKVRNAADASPNWMEPDAVGRYTQRLEGEISAAWRSLEAALD